MARSKGLAPLDFSVIFLCGWIIAGLITYAVEQQNARKEVVHTAEVLLSTAVAARDYTADQVRPLLRELETEEFLPQTVPSYAAQQLFKGLNQQYDGYTYVERALNPTNLKDLAEGWQVELIREFITNPDLKEIIGQRSTKQGLKSVYVAQPIQIKSQSCLQCHGSPDDAPPALIKTYGDARGFGWKLNEIVGIRLLSVPTSMPEKQARQAIFSFLLLLASIFLIAYTAVSLIVRRWVVSPLNSIAHLVEEISLRKVEGSQLPDGRSDEIGKLSQSINRLLISLSKALSNCNLPSSHSDDISKTK
ncbi:MAG: DUF3365 domain-containing protein [Moorea sp. SIO3G5]|nr:DUF3365 domain-containing protein [Moorena sp. SIO3G5]